jgi:thiamine-phosphate pyrophosphorylase
MGLPLLYPILDSLTLTRRGVDPVTTAEVMIEGGARILQFRHKENYSREAFRAATRMAELCRAANIPLIIDDRADVALLLDAGVHIGQDDLPPQDARRILGAQRMIGFSTHTGDQFDAALAEPVDYLAFGPIFPTQSKANPDDVVGLERLRNIAARRAGRPLVAIGGITRANALEVLAAGADSVAVIHDMLPDICTRQALRARMEEWQQLVNKHPSRPC